MSISCFKISQLKKYCTLIWFQLWIFDIVTNNFFIYTMLFFISFYFTLFLTPGARLPVKGPFHTGGAFGSNTISTKSIHFWAIDIPYPSRIRSTVPRRCRIYWMKNWRLYEPSHHGWTTPCSYWAHFINCFFTRIIISWVGLGWSCMLLGDALACWSSDWCCLQFRKESFSFCCRLLVFFALSSSW